MFEIRLVQLPQSFWHFLEPRFCNFARQSAGNPAEKAAIVVIFFILFFLSFFPVCRLIDDESKERGGGGGGKTGSERGGGFLTVAQVKAKESTKTKTIFY